MPIHHQPFEPLINQLCQQGYAICEDFLPGHSIQPLIAEIKQLQFDGKLTPAKVGKQQHIVNATIRNDAIYWLEENEARTAINVYFQQMQALKHQLNQSLFMGLQELEAHFAIYPVGGAYKKHLDQFRSDQSGHTSINSRARQLSSILYLNEDWKIEDGGELRLYMDEQNHLDIVPDAGKLVVFLSGRFWHEVLPAKRERMSLTGWFK